MSAVIEEVRFAPDSPVEGEKPGTNPLFVLHASAGVPREASKATLRWDEG
jgi:hypothetical protein